MNNEILSNGSIFQDRDLRGSAAPVARINSWKRLTEGDERADKFEGLLRWTLVTSLLCAMLLCALSFGSTSDQTSDDLRVAVPTVSLPQGIDKAPAAAVQAAVKAF